MLRGGQRRPHLRGTDHRRRRPVRHRDRAVPDGADGEQRFERGQAQEDPRPARRRHRCQPLAQVTSQLPAPRTVCMVVRQLR